MRAALISRRRALGFTQQSLAHEVGAAQTTVARWERGETEVSAHHREPLATALQWSLTELDSALNGGSLLPLASDGWFSNYVTLEQSAKAVRLWEPTLVPGLLQTRDYAAALLPNDNDHVIRRLDRQRMLTRPTDSVELVAVIDEGALFRQVGGRQIFADQLRHLVTMCERPNITVHVLPFDVDPEALKIVTIGSVVIVEFPWQGGLVYLEHVKGSRSLDTFFEVDSHLRAFDQLREMALPPRDSLDRVKSAAIGEANNE